MGVTAGGLAWRHITGAGLIGGVGMTVRMFITGLAFSEARLVEDAKVGGLEASLIATLGGYLFFLLVIRGSKPVKKRGASMKFARSITYKYGSLNDE